MRSHLRLHRQLARKKPYERKVEATAEAFAAMRAAETKRRRKSAANLAEARKGHIAITARRTHILWAPNQKPGA